LLNILYFFGFSGAISAVYPIICDSDIDFLNTLLSSAVVGTQGHAAALSVGGVVTAAGAEQLIAVCVACFPLSPLVSGATCLGISSTDAAFERPMVNLGGDRGDRGERRGAGG